MTAFRHTHANDPAFPRTARSGEYTGGEVQSGMTWREHVAVEAMKAIVSGTLGDGLNEGPVPMLYLNGQGVLQFNIPSGAGNVARLAFEMADAFIQEAAKGGGGG